MSLTPVFRPEAARDLQRHMDYIARRDRRSAQRLYHAIRQTVSRLAEMPGLGGVYGFTDPRVREIRVWQARGFDNYLIFYLPRETELLVIRVLHAAQDIDGIFAADE